MAIENFGLIGNNYINLYSDDNPMLHINDECYFLFNNIVDYHILLIGKGKIIKDYITDGMHKTYFIQLEEIIESPEILKKFIYNKQFNFQKLIEEKVNNYINTFAISENTELTFFAENLMKIDCFFVRSNLENILILKEDYKKTIISDLKKQLSELEEH
jgi:hypothetical protein